MPLRTEPIQARSTARVRALLDATADLIDEVGIERVTTNLIAERAGSSIGTLYRYFPDRIAVLRGLALRHASTLHDDFQRELALVASDEHGLEQAIVAVSERLMERFRDDPGWSAIGFSHALDWPLDEGEQQLVSPPLRGTATPRAQIARDVAIRFSDNAAQMRELSGHLEIALVLVQALIDRVFATGAGANARVLEETRAAIRAVARQVAEAHRVRRRAESVS